MNYHFSSEHTKILKKIGFDFDPSCDLSDEQIIEIGDKVGDYLVLNCLDEDYNETPDGEICQEILVLLAQ